MTQKLSPHKVSKMISLYFEGYSQSEISYRLNVDQSTVSLYVSRYKSLADQQGLQACVKEYGVMDQVEVLHSLAAELRKAKLTVEEAAIGLNMERIFRKFGVQQENYKDLIQSCEKMKSEGFIAAAVTLNKLESDTGMTYEEIVDNSVDSNNRLKKAEKELNMVVDKLNRSKEEVVGIDKQKHIADQELEAQMRQIGVDKNRLKMVEDLAVALKEAGISNKDLEGYFHNQQLLNKAGVSIEMFAEILSKVRVLTAQDRGKELVKMLSEYDGLVQVIKVLQDRQKALEKQVSDLENKKKLKIEIEGNIAKLKAEQTNLERSVANLSGEKGKLVQLQSDVRSLNEKKGTLENSIVGAGKRRDQLVSEIEALEQKNSNLKELEVKHDSLSDSLIKMEAEINSYRTQQEVLSSFLGFMEPASHTEIEKFVSLLPNLLAGVKQKSYSPEFLRDYILKNLSGGMLSVLMCTSCQTRFTVDKPSRNTLGYYCPVCFSSLVKVIKNESAIIKEALAEPEVKVLVPRPRNHGTVPVTNKL